MNESHPTEPPHKALVRSLFAPHEVQEVGSRVPGLTDAADFLLCPVGASGWATRCENVAGQHWPGRLAFELVCADRPRMQAGWLLTSYASWWLCWYPGAELVVLPVHETRRHVVATLARHPCTSLQRETHLAWNTLPEVNELIHDLECARVLDLHRELGLPRKGDRVLDARSLARQCSLDDLLALMRTRPVRSAPVFVGAQALQALVNDIAHRDLRRLENAAMRRKAPWLSAP